jgi:hypothetical protein
MYAPAARHFPWGFRDKTRNNGNSPHSVFIILHRLNFIKASFERFSFLEDFTKVTLYLCTFHYRDVFFSGFSANGPGKSGKTPFTDGAVLWYKKQEFG